MSDDSLANAGITPKERLTNIETILTRIDSKLDGKANQSDVAAMELRVRAIEVANALTFDTKDRLDKVEADAKVRLDRVEADAQSRIERVEHEVSGLGKKIAYAAGSLAVVVVIVNLVAARFVASL